MNLIDLDEKQVNAVAARIELDLRLGACFTRFQTLSLQTMGPSLEDRIISYGRSQSRLENWIRSAAQCRGKAHVSSRPLASW